MKNWKSIITGIITTIAVVFAIWMFREEKFPTTGEVSITASAQDELCNKHGLLVEECFFCDANLREPGRLWCDEHERYEDRCFICHPEIQEADRLWCEEHKLYEDECFFCHPELRKDQNWSREEAAGVSLIAKNNNIFSNELQCLEHGVLEMECGICHPELIEILQPGQGLKIRLESSKSAEKAGIKTAFPTLGNPLPDIVFLGELSYNRNRLARVTPLADGVVKKVLVDLGGSVSKGQALVEIVSPEIARIKSDYLNALANEALKELVFKREKGLVEKKISSQQEYDQALTEYQMARNTTTMIQQQLLNYGLIDGQIREVVETRSNSSRLQILAPLSGIIIERNAVIGEAVNPGDMLFTVADLSSMWLELSVPEDELRLIRLSDSVEATFDALPGMQFPGQLIWISSSIDDRTRTVKARAIVPNDDLILKNGMFGRVNLTRKESKSGFILPSNALQVFDGTPVVFVKLDDDLYDLRKVSLGGKTKEQVEIIDGLLLEDEVVVAHSYTLKSEFLKSRLGAGCVDE